MEIKLIRDLSTQRNKEQEDSIETTMNLALYFDINKSIDKIDSWKFSNIKKLVKNISDAKELEMYYSSWNKNIEYILEELNIKPEFVIDEIDQSIKRAFENRDVRMIHEAIKDAEEQPNMKLALLMLVAEITKDEKVIEITNRSVNDSIIKIDLALEMVLPILLAGDNNE